MDLAVHRARAGRRRVAGADRFDGALDDVFQLQDQVASGVVGAIEPRLRQSEFERTSRKPTERFDAYDLYLRALALRADWTRPDPAITAYIQSFGRYGIPVNVVYGPGRPNGELLPELLSTELVMKALDHAAGPGITSR